MRARESADCGSAARHRRPALGTADPQPDTRSHAGTPPPRSTAGSAPDGAPGEGSRERRRAGMPRWNKCQAPDGLAPPVIAAPGVRRGPHPGSAGFPSRARRRAPTPSPKAGPKSRRRRRRWLPRARRPGSSTPRRPARRRPARHRAPAPARGSEEASRPAAAADGRQPGRPQRRTTEALSCPIAGRGGSTSARSRARAGCSGVLGAPDRAGDAAGRVPAPLGLRRRTPRRARTRTGPPRTLCFSRRRGPPPPRAHGPARENSAKVDQGDPRAGLGGRRARARSACRRTGPRRVWRASSDADC